MFYGYAVVLSSELLKWNTLLQFIQGFYEWLIY